jgi:4-phospho-D-threonate 3-dehydrogenase / 4-phospho-D-erythronate 3-dehydrogenase
MNKKIDVTVTGPINKEAINLGGFHYAGHTEIYAEFTHTKDYAMIENLGLKLSLLEGIRGLC